ncbi:MAG: SCO6745 family protein [Acidimicrobiales bacterium]
MIAARALAGALEPVTGQVYFSPECHSGYEALGFAPSPAKMGDVALPDGPAYFCSRASVMGQAPGELVAAAFGVFNPAVVVPAVAHGWTLTDAATICQARTEGAIGQLRRILGGSPPGVVRASELLERANDGLGLEGRALYAGQLALGLPDDPIGDMWRLGDRLREYRGDSHIAAWTSAGFDATEIGLVTELYWGLPLRSYVRSRGWSDQELDAAEARLVERGLVADGAFTDAGRAEREAIEVATDRACQPIVDNLGGDLDELLAILGTWGGAIQAAGGYPAAGPHDLARLSRA